MINPLIRLFDPNRLNFLWRYWRRNTPWDTQITPPEVMKFIEKTPPGKALDLGCGTGTNAITLAQCGWQVTGVDFVPKAIRKAKRKAADAELTIDFHAADVTNLDWITEIYDYVLDIGCLHTLNEEGRHQYADTLARLIKPKGWYMLYCWLPRTWKGRNRGISSDAVVSLLRFRFSKIRIVIGEEKGFPSAWYWFQRKEDTRNAT